MSQDTFTLKDMTSKRGRGRPPKKENANRSNLMIKGDTARAFHSAKENYDAQNPYRTDNHQFMLVLLDSFQRSAKF